MNGGENGAYTATLNETMSFWEKTKSGQNHGSCHCSGTANCLAKITENVFAGQFAVGFGSQTAHRHGNAIA